MKRNTDPPELPVSIAVDSLRELDRLIIKERWDACIPLSKHIIKNVALALRPETCKTGKPHLDGVYSYSTGKMYYSNAPPDVRRALNMMNRIIRTAKESLR